MPYSSEQMFNLVSNVECYPDFLPWCQSARVYNKKDAQFTADLVVGNEKFKESFTSIVRLSPYDAIKVEYGGGALKHLSNEWTFKPVGDGSSCEVHFLVDFSLKSRLLGAMMELFFNQAFKRMVSAFEKRAEELYGDQDGS